MSYKIKYCRQDICVINDPLGQTQSPASSDHYFYLKLGLLWEIFKSGDGRMDVQTECEKIVTTTDRDCGSVKWINSSKVVGGREKLQEGRKVSISPSCSFPYNSSDVLLLLTMH